MLATTSGWKSAREPPMRGSWWGLGDGHSALTPSKGSPQALQRCRDLQAVALNSAVRRVSAEPQRGQAAGGGAVSVSGMGPDRRGAGVGGAMPLADSLRWPSSVIQSVVQGGASWVLIVTWAKPAG